MPSKLLNRILQLINPRSVNITDVEQVTHNSLPPMSTGTPMPPVKPFKPEPHLEFTDADGSWTLDAPNMEIKIDLAGKIFFKINRVWVEQTAIESIKFYK